MAGAGNNALGILILVAGLGLVIYLLVGENIARYARPTVSRVQSQAPGWLNWRTLISPGLAVGLALLMRVPLLSFYIVLIGLLTLWVAYNKAKLAELAKMNKQVSRLVFAFRNVYKIQPVVFAALREVLGRLDQPLKDWIDRRRRADQRPLPNRAQPQNGQPTAAADLRQLSGQDRAQLWRVAQEPGSIPDRPSQGEPLSPTPHRRGAEPQPG